MDCNEPPVNDVLLKSGMCTSTGKEPVLQSFSAIAETYSLFFSWSIVMATTKIIRTTSTLHLLFFSERAKPASTRNPRRKEAIMQVNLLSCSTPVDTVTVYTLFHNIILCPSHFLNCLTLMMRLSLTLMRKQWRFITRSTTSLTLIS